MRSRAGVRLSEMGRRPTSRRYLPFWVARTKGLSLREQMKLIRLSAIACGCRVNVAVRAVILLCPLKTMGA